MNLKKGISMIVLIITIILIIILTSTVIITVEDAIVNATIAAFAQDLKSVEEATTIYYQQNDEFPVLGENKACSKGEILQIVPNDKKDEFVNELNLNNDNVENDNLGAFYMIDLAKLNVEETSRGLQKDENGNQLLSDVFVISYPSMNVYYLHGLTANDTEYFSLSSKITKVIKVEDIINYTNQKATVFGLRQFNNVGTIQDVTVKREVKTWTNKLNLLIEADMTQSESLYFSFGMDERYKLNTISGYNSIYFSDSFESYNLNSSEEKIATGITSADIENFKSIPQDQRKMVIIKEENGAIEGQIEVDLSNYDTDLPVRVTEAEVTSNVYNNKVTFKVEDNTSGIKEVKYEYLRVYDENAQTKLYYNEVENYDISYIYSRGKSAKLNNDGTVELDVPKDVEGIQIRVFDKAGNASEVINQNTSTPIYIGINEINPTKTSVHLDNVIKTNESVNYATIQISTDDVNYNEEVRLNLVEKTQGIFTSSVDCEDLVNVEDKIYIKLNVYYSNNKVETRIKEISTYNQIENLGEGTRNIQEAAYDKPYVPVEFKYLEGKVNSGYVIKDRTNENEFVWIPVKEISEYKRGVIADSRDLTSYIEEDNDINKAIKNSVEKYGGFYIGRYETRYNGNAMYDNTNTGTYLKGDLTPVINNSSNIWNYISNDYAKTISASMYNTKTKSTLINSYAYDTTLNWLVSTNNKTSEQVSIDSTSWGNYLNSKIENVTSYTLENTISTVLAKENPVIKDSGKSMIINSLNSNYTSANNIFDLAGNVYEWTTETYSGSCIGRGGRYNSLGNERPAAYRFTASSTDASNHDVGFRVMLYFE